MALTTIPQKPLYPGTPPNRLNQTQSEFSANADDGFAYLETEPVSQNAVTDAMNLLGAEIEQIGADAESSAEAAVSSANFKGKWVDLTGALNIPSSVFHNDSYWQLVSNLTDVTLSEPTELSTDWEISYTEQRLIDAEDAAEASALSASDDADRAEQAVTDASLNAGMYEDTVTGLLATVDGNLFTIISTNDDGFADLYKNVVGVAVYQGKTSPDVTALPYIFKDKYNLLDTATLIPDGYILQTDGSVVPSASHFYTDYIEIKGGEKYNVADIISTGDTHRAATYDENFIFVEGYVSPTAMTFASNAKYVRISFNIGVVTQKRLLTDYFFGIEYEYNKRVADSTPYKNYLQCDDFEEVCATKLKVGSGLPVDTSESATTKEILSNSILDHLTTNLLDKTTALEDTNIDSSGYPKFQANIGMQDVPVQPSTDYSISTELFRIFSGWWLDANKEPISDAGVVVSGSTLFTSLANARYFRVAFNYEITSGDITANQSMVVEGGVLPSEYTEYEDVFKLKTELLAGAKGNKDWSSYLYAAIGDSRTAGYNSNLPGTNDEGYQYTRAYPDVDAGGWSYPADIKYNTAVILDNRSVTGAAWAYRSALTTIPTMYEQLSGFDGGSGVTLGTHIITVHGGTNDQVVESNPTGNEVLLDDPLDLFRHDTFKGSIRLFIRHFVTTYPDCVLVFLINTKDATKDAAIEGLANEYSFPVLKLYENSGTTLLLNAEMQAADPEQQSYSTDGTHESVRGQKMLGKHVAGEMAKYLW